jgi:hypothetical protein
MMVPFEQFYVQKHHQENKLVTEQHPEEHNPLTELAIETTKIHTNKINNEPPAQGNRYDTSTPKSPPQTSPLTHVDDQQITACKYTNKHLST